MQVFLKYKYNVKTCLYTISALYQIINLNVSIVKGIVHPKMKMLSSFTHPQVVDIIQVAVIMATFPRPETWRWTKRTVICCLTCRSNSLMGGPWPMKAIIDSRPSAVSLKVWLRETRIISANSLLWWCPNRHSTDNKSFWKYVNLF